MEKLENSDLPIGMFQRQACYTFVVQYSSKCSNLQPLEKR